MVPGLALSCDKHEKGESRGNALTPNRRRSSYLVNVQWFSITKEVQINGLVVYGCKRFDLIWGWFNCHFFVRNNFSYLSSPNEYLYTRPTSVSLFTLFSIVKVNTQNSNFIIIYDYYFFEVCLFLSLESDFLLDLLD